MCAKKLAAQPSLCGIAQSERRHSQSLLSPYLNRKILKFSDIGYKTPCNHPIIIFLSQISGHILLGVRFGMKRQPLLSHIYNIILFAPLKLGQYLRYIDNVDVKSFVLVEIELLVFRFLFRCIVQEDTTFLWQKVSFVGKGQTTQL